MKTKIKWFKEVLELEPASKVFFPLAKLLFEDGSPDEALSTLENGLERNPDHLEARFLLVEILSGLGREDTASAEVQTITGMLSKYPSFWKVWAERSAPASKDSAMALTFLAANFQGAPISWSQVIEKGLDSLFQANGGSKAAAAPQVEAAVKTPEIEAVSAEPVAEPAPEPEPEPAASPSVKDQVDDDANLRTRTMADLLADQGDYQGALDIYQELAACCADNEVTELEDLITRMQEKLSGSAKPEPAPEPEVPVIPGKEKLLNTLEALADRLEARASM